MIDLLAHCLHLVHNQAVRETSRAWFGDQNCKRRTNRRPGGIFSSTAMPSMSGIGGDSFGNAGSFCAGSPTPSIAAHPFGDGRGVTAKGGHAMATTPRASAHTSPIKIAHAAGAQAARRWYSDPVKSLGFARDLALAEFIAEMNFNIAKLDEIDSFEKGFSDGLAQAISGGASHA